MICSMAWTTIYHIELCPIIDDPYHTKWSFEIHTCTEAELSTSGGCAPDENEQGWAKIHEGRLKMFSNSIADLCLGSFLLDLVVLLS